MRKSLVLGTLSLTMLLGLPACGGDDDGTSGSSETGSGTDGGDGDGDTETGDATSDTGDTTGDGDGDTTSDTTGDGDGDTTTGDGDGDTTDSGDGDTGGDGDGDVCEVGFSTLVSTDNTMTTNLKVEGIISCDKPIDIVANGGTVCINDAGGGNSYYVVNSINFDDVPPTSCGFAMLGLQNLSISNNGDGTEVTIPSAGGDMTGNQSIAVNGEAYGSAPIIGTIDPTALDGFEGSLPEGNATTGSNTTVTYDDNSHIMATAMPEVSGQMLTVTLTGLQGSLTFDP